MLDDIARDNSHHRRSGQCHRDVINDMKVGGGAPPVIDALAWPSIRCTALTFAPADTARLAALCRGSCGVMVGNVSSEARRPSGIWSPPVRTPEPANWSCAALDHTSR
jgi:hypothetical protein